MKDFNIINPKELNLNPFHLIGDEWMLITTEKDGKVNTMTASWGGLGVIWNMNVAYVFIRDSRYTKEFIDVGSSFSLSFLDHKKFAKELAYLGTVSGRSGDKIEAADLHILNSNGVPYIKEASKVMICNKLFAQKMEPKSFVADYIDAKFYGDKDYHTLYIGEIKEVLVRS